MKASRVSKILLVAGVALYLSLIGYNNVTDYLANLVFVQHVLTMDTVSQVSPLLSRAVTNDSIHHAFYFGIIGWEILAALLCWYGVFRLGRSLRADGQVFNRAKSVAIRGLTLSLLLWLVAFLCVGGEWFIMWQSPYQGGQNAAFRMFAVTGIVLIYLNQPDHDA